MRTQTQLALRVVRHLILAAVVTTLGAADVHAQGGVTESWRDAVTDYVGRRHALDPAGNLLVVGDSRVGGDIIQVRKYSPTGQLLWSRIYDPPERVRSYWIASDPGGNAWVTAAGLISQNTAVGFRVLKYDPQGNLLFVDATNGGATCCVVTDSAGNGYVAGNGWFTGAADAYMVVKYAPDGTRLWTGFLDSGSSAFLARPMSMALSPDETRLVVAGGGSSVNFRALSVAMYDTASGQRHWNHVDTSRYGGNAVAFAPDGASVFVGNTDIATNPTSMGLHKFDVAGNLLFRRSYTDGIAFSRLAVDGAGNVVLLGTAASLPTVPGRDWMTVKTNAAGTRLWARRYDGSHTFDEVPDWVTVDAAGAVYVAGMGGPSPSVGNVSVLKTVTAKYDSAGTPIWAAFNGGNTQVTVDDAGGVFTLGDGVMTSARFEQTGASDPIPSAPTQLTATGSFSGVEFRIDLAWTNNATNEFFHAIERCPGAKCTNFAEIGRTTGANSGGFRDSPLTSGATYTYRVRAVGFTGNSAYSNSAVGATPAISAPAAPSNLVATLSGGSAQLSWTDNAVNEDQFLIERCDGPGCSAFTQIGASEANVASYVDPAIVAGQSYSYRVRAWTSGGGYSDYTNVASVGPPLALPAAPTNLAAIAGKRRIKLTWVNTATNATSITVERCSGSTCTAFSAVAQLPGTATSWTNQGLTSGGTYRYRVYASNAAGSSAHSNIASATAH
jgi:fibronectin type 3 domain-containing protein